MCAQLKKTTNEGEEITALHKCVCVCKSGGKGSWDNFPNLLIYHHTHIKITWHGRMSSSSQSRQAGRDQKNKNCKRVGCVGKIISGKAWPDVNVASPPLHMAKRLKWLKTVQKESLGTNPPSVVQSVCSPTKRKVLTDNTCQLTRDRSQKVKSKKAHGQKQLRDDWWELLQSLRGIPGKGNKVEVLNGRETHYIQKSLLTLLQSNKHGPWITLELFKLCSPRWKRSIVRGKGIILTSYTHNVYMLLCIYIHL